MNKKEFEKELDEKLASLKEEMMQKFEEQEDEFPKYGDRYYYLATSGNIESIIWTDDEFDRCTLAMGNLFKTEEVAKFECERRKVITELKKFAEPEDRKWDGMNQHSFFYYNMRTDKFYTSPAFECKEAVLYFETEEKAMEAIRMVGEARVKKYYLGVED